MQRWMQTVKIAEIYKYLQKNKKEKPLNPDG